MANSSFKLPDLPKESLGTLRNTLSQILDQWERENLPQDSSPTEKLRYYVIESFKHAVWIFEWVRNGLPYDHSTNEYAYSLKGFIEYCLKLELNIQKIGPLIKSGWPKDLPKAPGTTCFHEAGLSIAEALYRFSQSINNYDIAARCNNNIDIDNEPSILFAPKPDQRLIQWQEYIFEGLREFLPKSDWPQWKIQQEFHRLLSLMKIDSEKQVRHSSDFRYVNWFGIDYAFTAMQADAIEILYENWRKGTPDLGEAFILSTIDSDGSQLKDIFKHHSAWGIMIQQGATKGSHRLVSPEEIS